MSKVTVSHAEEESDKKRGRDVEMEEAPGSGKKRKGGEDDDDDMEMDEEDDAAGGSAAVPGEDFFPYCGLSCD